MPQTEIKDVQHSKQLEVEVYEVFRDNVIYYATKREMTFKDLANKASRYVEASIRPSYDDGGYISKLFIRF